MTPTRDELLAFRDVEVPDLVGPGCRLLFVGINPGLWTAAVGAHFARPGNRFYPALYRAGIVDRLIDASRGMSDEDRDLLYARGIGITNVVARATAAGIVIVISAGNDGAENPDAFTQVANNAAIARGQVIIAGSVGSGDAIS